MSDYIYDFMYHKYNLLKQYFHFVIIFLPFFCNIILHIICEYFECNNWYNLFGHNLICNACIDGKKIIKDHQISIYITFGTLLFTKLNSMITLHSNFT